MILTKYMSLRWKHGDLLIGISVPAWFARLCFLVVVCAVSWIIGRALPR